MKRSALFFALISATTVSFAADEPTTTTELPAVLVTSNRIAQADFKAPFASEIHNATDIQKSGAINLYEYLKRFSSVNVMPSYGNPFSQQLDMRGFGLENGHQNIVVTINGRRLNNIDTAPQLLSSIPITSIERIEIIKGSGAVAQGDGAMSGTINIVTKDQTGGSVNLSGGSHGHSSASASLGISQEYFALQVLAENARADGFRDADIKGQNDESDINNLSASLKIFPTKESELRFGKERAWLDTTYGGAITQAQFDKQPKQNNSKEYNHQKFETDVTHFGGSYRFTTAARLNADYAIEKKDSNYLSPWPSEMSYDYRSTDVSAEFKMHDLILVVGTQLFDGERNDSSSQTNKDNMGVYLQANYQLENTVLNAGFRREEVKYEYSDAATELKDKHTLNAWELGANHQFNDELSIFANFTSGFQAPDIDRFFATQYDSNWNAIGTIFNGFIVPAKHKTFNLGFNHFVKTNQLKATVFYSKLSNEIFLDPITFNNTNIDKSYKYGLELQDRYQLLDNLALRGNYTWTKAKIDKENTGNGTFDGKNMPGVSEHNLTAGVEYQVVTDGLLSLNQTWRSKAYALNDFANNFSQKQKAFNTTDLSYAHSFESFTLYAQIDNIFAVKNGLWVADDAIYPVNFTRVWYAGIRASF